ncbi:hypothetical protein EMIT0P44_30061 [Pseudomonas sp. IT-P44]
MGSVDLENDEKTCRSEPARDAVCQSPSLLTDIPLSRAGSLPQGLCVVFRPIYPHRSPAPRSRSPAR